MTSANSPLGWTVVRLGDVMEEVDVRAKSLSSDDAKGITVLSLTKKNGLIPQSERFDKRIATEDISKYKVVRKSQIVYNPYVIWEGAIHALRKSDRGVVSPVYLVWEAVHADFLFLDYLFKTQELLNTFARVSSGVVKRRMTVSKQTFSNLEVALPPIAEQRAIARTLLAVQEAKEARQRELSLERERKAVLRQHLLNNGTRGEAQRQTKNGIAPRSWEFKKLEELLREKLKNGHSAKESIEGDIRTLTLTAVTKNDFSPANTKLTNADPEKVKDLWLQNGDILIERANTPEFVGLAALYHGRSDFAIYPDLMIRVRVDEEIMIPKYLTEYLLIEQCRAYFRRNAAQTAGNFPKIDQRTVLNTMIAVPTLAEQEEIAGILSACDSKINALKQEIDLLDELFETLLEELMTGRLSVVQTIEAEAAA